ncbi:MAG: NAD(P)-dependent oxidoreductase [Rhodobacteraceae bacterium]|nr:NAD(P)-dependent oxidoreductase [Paracoccaceae bacterium]
MSDLVIGWIGIGRMGYAMVERLLDAGYEVKVWNRTKSKAEPLISKGAVLVDSPNQLASVDVLGTMVSTGKDLEQVYLGENGVLPREITPEILLDCSSIAVDQSADIRNRVTEKGCIFLAAPVSGTGKCVTAGKLSSVVSGPREAFERVKPIISTYAVRGVSYVGEGELARFCKIAHNLFLGTVITSLIEMTLLTNKAGVPRRDFLDFINNSVMGSIFTRYKSNALINLDWSTTFTPHLLMKDLDLGRMAASELRVNMPTSAITREILQSHFGAAQLQDDPAEYLEMDFAAILETLALASGMKLESENSPYPTGLEISDQDKPQ